MRKLYRVSRNVILTGAILFLSVAPVKAEGVSDLLSLYNIKGVVSSTEVYKKLNEIEIEVNEVFNEVNTKRLEETAYNDFVLTYSAFLASTDSELALIEKDLEQAELLMMQNKESDISEILKLDSTYRNLRDIYTQLINQRKLLSQQFENVKEVKVTTEELQRLEKVEAELVTTKSKYADIIKEEDLGEIVGKHPVDNVMFITSTYGYRTNPKTGKGFEFHKGLDFRGNTGTPILSKYNGTVLKTGTNSLSGNYVWVDHGGSVQTVYSHLSKISVKQGQKVTQYEKIGELGSTGRSTGPHLHFGLYINGEAVDPILTIQ